MNVPAGKLGSQFQSLVGGSTDPNKEIPLNIGLGGTYLDPKPKLLMSEQKEQVKEAVKEKVVSTVEEKGKDLVTDVVKDTKAKDIVGNLLGTKKDSTATKPDSTKTAAPVQDLLKNKMQNLLKKKKN